ncbi:MAG: hypothetical protein HC924_06205 [Synechococcaceae cyanobacterium SM2_3_2]|nr:hypothetical protein [Synechococcaceae cyanobacterium SM2_3_2]
MLVSLTTSPQPAPCCVVVVPAQNFDQDVLGDVSRGWSHFVETGQIWALLIGLVVGYLIRNMTAS